MNKLMLLLSLMISTQILAIKHFKKLTQAEKIERAEKRLEYNKAVKTALDKSKDSKPEYLEKAKKAVERSEKHLDFIKSGKKLNRAHNKKEHVKKDHVIKGKKENSKEFSARA